MTSFPPTWRFGPTEAEAAQRLSPWTAEEAREEFGRFRSWHEARDNRSPSWPAWWENWCRKGQEIAERGTKRSVSRPDKIADAVAGLRRWGAEQAAARRGISSDDGAEDSNDDSSIAS